MQPGHAIAARDIPTAALFAAVAIRVFICGDVSAAHLTRGPGEVEVKDIRVLQDRLRDRIVSALHVGHLQPGQRIPSIREVAEETGADARAVARAYRLLEREGLVEVRDRSGVFAAMQPRVGGVVLEESARWAARVLVDGWRRGVPVPELPDFFRRCAKPAAVRCAFVESSEDVITAFCHDLGEGLGLDTVAVRLEPDAGSHTGSRPPTPEMVRGVDLVVTTAFHAPEVGHVAEAAGIPMITATVNVEMVAAIERQLRSGSLTIVCSDPAFGERFRHQYADQITPDTRLRIVLAEDARAVAGLERNQPVLLTRAARRHLPRVHLPLVFSHAPTISTSSALQLAEFVVRFTLEGAAGPAARSAPNGQRSRPGLPDVRGRP
jgi:GntR family transcriptional regulator